MALPTNTPHFTRAETCMLRGQNRPLTTGRRRADAGERALPRVLAVIGAVIVLALAVMFSSCTGLWVGINSGGPTVSGSIGAYFPIDGWGAGGYNGPIGPPPPQQGTFHPIYNPGPFRP